MTISRAPWGKTADGHSVELFTLTNARGATAKVTTYGAILTELHIPDKAGRLANIVLGFPHARSLSPRTPLFRRPCIGRYANRIAKGTFSIADKNTVPHPRQQWPQRPPRRARWF